MKKIIINNVLMSLYFISFNVKSATSRNYIAPENIVAIRDAARNAPVVAGCRLDDDSSLFFANGIAEVDRVIARIIQELEKEHYGILVDTPLSAFTPCVVATLKLQDPRKLPVIYMDPFFKRRPIFRTEPGLSHQEIVNKTRQKYGIEFKSVDFEYGICVPAYDERGLFIPTFYEVMPKNVGPLKGLSFEDQEVIARLKDKKVSSDQKISVVKSGTITLTRGYSLAMLTQKSPRWRKRVSNVSVPIKSE